MNFTENELHYQFMREHYHKGGAMEVDPVIAAAQEMIAVFDSASGIGDFDKRIDWLEKMTAARDKLAAAIKARWMAQAASIQTFDGRKCE